MWIWIWPPYKQQKYIDIITLLNVITRILQKHFSHVVLLLGSLLSHLAFLLFHKVAVILNFSKIVFGGDLKFNYYYEKGYFRYVWWLFAQAFSVIFLFFFVFFIWCSITCVLRTLTLIMTMPMNKTMMRRVTLVVNGHITH